MAENDVALALLRNELPVPGTAMMPAPEPNLGDHLRYIDYLMGKKVEDMGSAIARALMAPGNALRGEYDQVGLMGNGDVTMADPRMYDDASELAGLVGLGVMPMPRPTNSLGMFGGMNAKTADLDALKRAQTLEATGAPREAIWNDTGWFKGADGQWRFEIDDSRTMFKGTGNAATIAAEKPTAGEAFRHHRLFAAYPELAELPFKGFSKGPAGRYDPGDPMGLYGDPSVGLNNALPEDRMRSVMLHELQHGLQDIEGFDLGGSPSMYQQQADATLAMKAMSWRKEIARKRQQMPNASDEAIDAAIMAEYTEMGAPDWVPPKEARQVAFDTSGNPDEQLQQVINLYGLDQATTPHSPRELYHRTAGEVEARNVQTRMNMTPEQRRAQAPWLTQDVPDNLQIIRRMLTMKGPDK